LRGGSCLTERHFLEFPVGGIDFHRGEKLGGRRLPGENLGKAGEKVNVGQRKREEKERGGEGNFKEKSSAEGRSGGGTKEKKVPKRKKFVPLAEGEKGGKKHGGGGPPEGDWEERANRKDSWGVISGILGKKERKVL